MLVRIGAPVTPGAIRLGNVDLDRHLVATMRTVTLGHRQGVRSTASRKKPAAVCKARPVFSLPSAAVRSGQTVTDYDGDRLRGRGREGSVGELQLPRHHPRRRLGVGSSLLGAEAVVEEPYAQRAVDSLQTVVLGYPPRGLPRTAPGRTRPRKTAPAVGVVGKILSSSTLSTSREQIVQRRFSGAVILRLLSVGPAGRARPTVGQRSRSQGVISRRCPIALHLQAGDSAR